MTRAPVCGRSHRCASWWNNSSHSTSTEPETSDGRGHKLRFRSASQNKRSIKSTVADVGPRGKGERAMFERFTESARAVLVEAQDLAVELYAPAIDVGFVFYGCAQLREETAGKPLHERGITGASIRQLLPRGDEPARGTIDAASLEAIGIDLADVRHSVEETFGPGALDAAPDRRNIAVSRRRPPFTPEAKRALEQSLRVALELHDKRLEPGHLLLGLLRLNDGFISGVIERSGTTVAGLSSAVLTQLARG